MDILDKFIQAAKNSVAEGYYKVDSHPAQKVSLKEKLLSQDFCVITEIKHASPSGEYAPKEIDAEAAAQLFRQSGADAISCVVEPKFFRGKLGNIPLAKKAGLPVLFKDFVFCEEQIEAAKKLGADVILLVVKVAKRLGLDLNSLVQTAHDNDLEVLLESYDADELREALQTDADILGINNRDLQTLTVDVTRTKKILDEVGLLNKPLISESGIKTGADARFAKNAGVRGILVGTAIWTSPDIASKIRELREGVRE